MIKAAIVGVSGYTGGELIRILHRHPEVEVSAVSSRTYAGKPIGSVFASLYGLDYVCEDLSADEIAARADLVFTAVPHGVAMQYAPAVKRCGKRMIDIGADFRLRDQATYEKWYKVGHSCPEFLREAVYGLTELSRDQLRDSWLVANPGCYPTGAALGLVPLLTTKLADGSPLIVDAKSGVSGAGRKPSQTAHYCEVNEGVRPYGLLNHRHIPEMEQTLHASSGSRCRVLFSPHLVPMTRGIISTMYVRLRPGVGADEVTEAYQSMYGDERFIRLLDQGVYPSTKSVYGSNFCDISVDMDEESSTVVIVSAIDNMGKGASLQAVQNMNAMFGLDEESGIDYLPIYP